MSSHHPTPPSRPNTNRRAPIRSPFQLTREQIFRLHHKVELQTAGEIIRSQIALDADAARKNIMEREQAKKMEGERSRQAHLDQVAEANRAVMQNELDALTVRLLEADRDRKLDLRIRGARLREEIEADAQRATSAISERVRMKREQVERERAKKAELMHRGEKLRSQIALEAEMARLSIMERTKMKELKAELERMKQVVEEAENRSKMSCPRAGPIQRQSENPSPITTPRSYAEVIRAPSAMAQPERLITLMSPREIEAKKLAALAQAKGRGGKVDPVLQGTAKAKVSSSATTRKKWGHTEEEENHHQNTL